MQPTLLALVLLLGASLTGCIGGGPEAPSPTTPTETGSLAARDGLNATWLAPADVPATADQVHMVVGGQPVRTASFEGSFTAAAACIPAGCFLDNVEGLETSYRYHDLSDLIPIGIPVHIELRLSHDADGEVAYIGGGNSLGLLAPPHLEKHKDWEGGEVTVLDDELVRRGPGPLLAEVFHNYPEPDQRAVSYELEVRVELNTSRLPGGAPFQLDPAGGDALILDPGEDRALLASIWAPGAAGAVLVEARGPASIPLGAAGNHTFLVHTPRTGALTGYVLGAEGPPTAAPLPVERVAGPSTDVDEQGQATLELETEARPLWTTATLETALTSWKEGVERFSSGEEATVVLAGPLGPILEASEEMPYNCVVCPDPRTVVWATAPGDPLLVPGLQTVTFDTYNANAGTLRLDAVVWHPPR